MINCLVCETNRYLCDLAGLFPKLCGSIGGEYSLRGRRKKGREKGREKSTKEGNHFLQKFFVCFTYCIIQGKDKKIKNKKRRLGHIESGLWNISTLAKTIQEVFSNILDPRSPNLDS